MSAPNRKTSLSITLRKNRRIAFVLLLAAFIGTATAAPAPDDTAQLFARADAIKMIDNADYVILIAQLKDRAATLSDADRWHLRYLEAWQTGYIGQDDKARLMMEAIIKQAPDDDLREQARATLINILGVGHRYEEAFTYLDQALDDLPHIVRNSTRQHVLGEAAQLLIEAGQYDLAINYADQMLLTPAANGYSCIGTSVKLHAEFRKGPHTNALLVELQHGAATCLAAGNLLSADTLRRYIASLEIEEGKNSDAIKLLQDNYSDVVKLQYQDLVSEYDVLLADAYWKQHDIRLAEKYAYAAANIASKDSYMEPLSEAYKLLEQVARERGNRHDTLAYHEKFVAADSIHLGQIREKALAYQVAKQQMEAKKAEIDVLNKQNRILKLQQELDHKAVETGHLHITLLLISLALITLWLYRLKRSQLRFRRMTRCDDLTGILSHEHFVEEGKRSLRQATRHRHYASVILIDLDHFKSINHRYGHVVGDHILRRTVAACERHLHSRDVFGRLGGEEFGILLPECTSEQAIERAEQIRAAINATPADHSQGIPASASLGIASTTHHGTDLSRLLMAADEALQQAKREGRNRVVINMASKGTVYIDPARNREPGTANREARTPSKGHPSNYAAEK
jgi:diguanylate cyclase (GGDEF)-like protein